MKLFEIDDENLSKELIKQLNDEANQNGDVEKIVLDMVANIRSDGFKAVKEYSKKFDNFELTEENVLVKKEEIDILAAKISSELSSALEIAINRIKDFHKNQREESFSTLDKENNKMGQKIVPLEAVAVYIPGGGALYPSTLYMTVIPALIAGVKRIVLLSPPRTFEESPEVARLVQLLGIKEIYRVGGAQSVIAAAYGAGPIKPVDKIVGPGNIYVAKAKQLVFGRVDIDMMAGPSEILVIADTDKEEDIPVIASDLLSQVEHGPAGWTRAILIGKNKEFLLKVKDEAYKRAETLPLKENAIKSLNERGLVIVSKDIYKCMDISNILAPEHLELFSDDPYPLLERVKNAGSVFLGKYTPESVGDYLGGPNHVLPTSGTARFYSPLGVYDFQKRFSWIEFNRESLKKYAGQIALIARSEGLEAHARSAESRFNN